MKVAKTFVADPHLEAAGQDMNRLLLPVMNMERRPTVGRDLDDEVIEGAARDLVVGVVLLPLAIEREQHVVGAEVARRLEAGMRMERLMAHSS